MGLLRNRRPTITKRADELEPGRDRLATSNGELGVRRGGETVAEVTPGRAGGQEVVYVTTVERPRWCWPMDPATEVAIYADGGEG